MTTSPFSTTPSNIVALRCKREAPGLARVRVPRGMTIRLQHYRPKADIGPRSTVSLQFLNDAA